MQAIFDLFPNTAPIYQLDHINEFFKKIQPQFNVIDLLNDLEDGHDRFLTLIQEFVHEYTKLNGMCNEQKSMLHKIMSGILYLLVALELNHAGSNGTQAALKRGFTISFKSQIPIGAGLGSSAVFGVCVAAIFYIYTHTHSQPNFVKTFINTATNDEWQLFNNTVSSWAFLSERIMHGTPSGLDNTVCTFGNVVEFTKNPNRFINVDLKTKLNIMLVNTAVSRNTSEIVQKVRNLKSDHNNLIVHVMDAIGALVQDVVEVNNIIAYMYIAAVIIFCVIHRFLKIRMEHQMKRIT